jgi:hypothetical protein
MLSIAQWRDTTINTRFGAIQLSAGELIAAERDLAARFGLDRNAIQRLLSRMAKASMIRPTSIGKGGRHQAGINGRLRRNAHRARRRVAGLRYERRELPPLR